MNMPNFASRNHAIRSAEDGFASEELSAALAWAPASISIKAMAATQASPLLLFIAGLSLHLVDDRARRRVVDLDLVVLHQPDHLCAGEEDGSVAVDVVARGAVVVVDVVVGVVGAD